MTKPPRMGRGVIRNDGRPLASITMGIVNDGTVNVAALPLKFLNYLAPIGLVPALLLLVVLLVLFLLF